MNTPTQNQADTIKADAIARADEATRLEGVRLEDRRIEDVAVDRQALEDRRREENLAAWTREEDLSRELDERRRQEDERLDRAREDREREDQGRSERDREADERHERAFHLDESQGLAVLDERGIDRAQAPALQALAERQAKRDEQLKDKNLSAEQKEMIQREKTFDYCTTKMALGEEKAKALAETARQTGDSRVAARADAVQAEVATYRQRLERLDQKAEKAQDKKQGKNQKADASAAPAERNFAHERVERVCSESAAKHEAGKTPRAPTEAQMQRIERLQQRHEQVVGMRQTKQQSAVREQSQTLGMAA